MSNDSTIKPIQEDLTLKKYKVDLHSNPILKEHFSVRRYVDVEAINIGRAIIAALNIAGFTCFPSGWKNIKVKKLNENWEVIDNNDLLEKHNEKLIDYFLTEKPKTFFSKLWNNK